MFAALPPAEAADADADKVPFTGLTQHRKLTQSLTENSYKSLRVDTDILGQPGECQVESADVEGSDPAASPPSERVGLEAWLAGAGIAGRKFKTALALCYTEEVESVAELRLLHQVRAQRREAIAMLTIGVRGEIR